MRARFVCVVVAAALLLCGCGSASEESAREARISAALRTLEHDLVAGKVRAPPQFRGSHVLGTIALVYARAPHGVSEAEWTAAIAHDKRLLHVAEQTEVIPVGGRLGPIIATPARITNAGGRELAEYEAGKQAVAQSGCLACHRVGDQGNNGPGPDLTEVADRLPKRAIARTLVNPTAPMPSFKHLPPEKFRAIVAFLAELK
jgi:hypothetical protein